MARAQTKASVPGMIIGSIVAFIVVYFTTYKPQYDAHNTYLPAPCVTYDSLVRTTTCSRRSCSGSGSRRCHTTYYTCYYADLYVHYTPKDNPEQSAVVSEGDYSSFAEAQNVVSQYGNGTTPDCFYNPLNLAEVTRGRPSMTGGVIAISITGAFMGFCILGLLIFIAVIVGKRIRDSSYSCPTISCPTFSSSSTSKKHPPSPSYSTPTYPSVSVSSTPTGDDGGLSHEHVAVEMASLSTRLANSGDVPPTNDDDDDDDDVPPASNNNDDDVAPSYNNNNNNDDSVPPAAPTLYEHSVSAPPPTAPPVVYHEEQQQQNDDPLMMTSNNGTTGGMHVFGDTYPQSTL